MVAPGKFVLIRKNGSMKAENQLLEKLARKTLPHIILSVGYTSYFHALCAQMDLSGGQSFVMGKKFGTGPVCFHFVQ